MRFALERHPNAERRTIRFAPSAQETSIGDRFGPFAPLARKAVGDRYELVAAEPISGTVWFIGEYQLGLTIDGVGDGLLMVGRTPAQALASAILTTYGMAEPAFEALLVRWSRWWEALGAGLG